MNRQLIDSHIHLDMYEEADLRELLLELNPNHIKKVISVSNHLQSAKKNLALAKNDPRIRPTFGFHPEQPLPTDSEVAQLLQFIQDNQHYMIAIGEVGLPYYLRESHPEMQIEPYIELLEIFVQQTVKLNKPIILHAVYDDAPIVCDLLEKYTVTKAHFHWFKGDQRTIERMKQNNYYISVTPDVLYEQEIQALVKSYPIEQMMVETDGPWPFEGDFKGKMTHPKMMHQSIAKIAQLKNLELGDTYQTIYENTCRFYGISGWL
ncbi:TatD family hydrolase [Oceanobacillus rekensis]|uniref:TatD family hydrolase n=1 Tax=Oceanobacillus rekensis TaxID=937927 RepID=UPI000B44A18F|nr:TatD family hydrolase [Oceanobacillus rekensis]